MKIKSILLATLLSSSIVFAFDFGEFIGGLFGSNNEEKKEKGVNNLLDSLKDETIAKALKEALTVGVSFAVTALGKENGYLKNAEVKIPLPENLRKTEEIARKLGAGKYADELVKSMNDAASLAAPKTIDIFVNTISQMNIQDVKKILLGKDTQATDYFKTNSFDKLKTAISPIVDETMKKSSTAKYYSKLNGFYKDKVQPTLQSEKVSSYAKKLGMEKYVTPAKESKSLNEHITISAINGLFLMISKKESEIRNKVNSRKTSLLKDVFAAQD